MQWNTVPALVTRKMSVHHSAGDGSAAQSDIQAEKRTHDFDDALNEFRNAPSINIYSHATPSKHAEKQPTHKKVEGPTTLSTTPERRNSIPKRKLRPVKAQWGRKIFRPFPRIFFRKSVKRVWKKTGRGARRGQYSPYYRQQSSSYGQSSSYSY